MCDLHQCEVTSSLNSYFSAVKKTEEEIKKTAQINNDMLIYQKAFYNKAQEFKKYVRVLYSKVMDLWQKAKEVHEHHTEEIKELIGKYITERKKVISFSSEDIITQVFKLL